MTKHYIDHMLKCRYVDVFPSLICQILYFSAAHYLMLLVREERQVEKSNVIVAAAAAVASVCCVLCGCTEFEFF